MFIHQLKSVLDTMNPCLGKLKPILWSLYSFGSFSVSFRSVIFKRKRTESGNSLVSEGLREAITSYLQMTEGNDHSWDTWGKTADQSERMKSVRCCPASSVSLGKPVDKVVCVPMRSLHWPAWSSNGGWDTTTVGVILYVCKRAVCWCVFRQADSGGVRWELSVICSQMLNVSFNLYFNVYAF